jgi:hypothetical protein
VISEAETGPAGVSVVVRIRIADVLHCDPITFAPLEVNA